MNSMEILIAEIERLNRINDKLEKDDLEQVRKNDETIAVLAHELFNNRSGRL
ncbi:MAG: hypothetical protein LBB94_03955 [Clostridiales bacterium]|jgi:hypothetical protein|nr:hypothetical protein [Clostridiales bacterium]